MFHEKILTFIKSKRTALFAVLVVKIILGKNPQRSDQKGGCEVCHEMIRRVLPKKTSFDNLTQEDVSLLMSHINSYTRKKLNDQSANQLFSFLYGADTLAKLGIKVIPANEINLTPYLLKK